VSAGVWINAAIEKTGKSKSSVQAAKKTLHDNGLVRSEGKGNQIRWWTVEPEE
jgi:hypothetical protein